jgi:lipoprotein-releasing system permease protein
MNIAIATLKGFKAEIRNKIHEIQGDFIVDSGKNVENGEPNPIANQDVESILRNLDSKLIERAIPTSAKACILKSEDELEGVLAKGIDQDLVEVFLKAYIKQKSPITEQNWCAISTTTAKRLNIGLNDEFTTVFFTSDSLGNNRPRARKLIVRLIFETGMEQIDANSIWLDHEITKKFMQAGFQYTSVEIWTKTAKSMGYFENEEEIQTRKTKLHLNSILPNPLLRVNSLEEYNRQIFDWLSILNTNVVIILTLMLLVSVTSMGTTLLILAVERTRFIGLLMSMGARTSQIQSIFVILSSLIAAGGIVLGNILAISIVYFFNKYQWIQLNEEIYFIKNVVLNLDWMELIMIDLASLILILGSLFLPAQYIKKINLIKAITFK